MFWFVHFLRSFKGRALISNIFHCRQYQRDRETALSETKRENGRSEVSKTFGILRARVMANSPSIHSQYMTLLKGLLKGSRVNVTDKSFQELFHHVHWHCYWFHPEGRTIFHYKKWKKVMRALQRAQQRRDIIPVHVWSLCSLISSVLKPMTTYFEESRQVVTDTKSDMEHIS
jgi:hypothetical protein